MAILIPTVPVGKQLVTITELYGGDPEGYTPRTHALALDAHGRRYFIFMNAIEQTDGHTLDDYQIGTQVFGTVIEHPKGWRLIEVRTREI